LHSVTVRFRFVGVSRQQSRAPVAESDLAAGATVGVALASYGFNREAEVSVLVNGRAAEWDLPLVEGDEVVVVPPLVGGRADPARRTAHHTAPASPPPGASR
jgi:molybdopterin converting factor small subunit